MFYEFALTIPANTLAASPAERTVMLTAGFIKAVEVQLPSGLRGLVSTVVRRGLHQVWPSNPDGFINGDDARIKWGENYDITDQPHTLILRGWSPGTTYQHVIKWRFEVTPAPVKEVKKTEKKKGILSVFSGAGAV